MRDSSPPEATFATAFAGSPGIRAHQELDAIRARRPRVRCGIGFDGHLELSARHAKLAHQARDRGPEAARGGTARGREFGCSLVEALAKPCDALFKAAEHEFRLFERSELRPQLLEFRRQLRRDDAVLARKILDCRDAPLDLLLARRVGIEISEIHGEFAAGFAQGDS